MIQLFDRINHENIFEVVEFLKSNLAPGTLVFFEGDPGAGKTFIISKLLQCFEIQDVASPTFALHHQYQTTKLTFHHFDLYRVESEDELETVGVLELIDRHRDAIFLIEWASKFNKDLWPISAQKINLQIESTDFEFRNYRITIE